MTTTTSPRRFGALAAALTLLGTLIVTTAGADPATAAPVDCSRGVNLSFEEPVIAQDWRIVATPGWATTDTGIEIWRSGFLGATAPDGAQLSELQANNNAPNWQDIPTLGGDEIDWSFFHRGRRDADRVQVRMGSTTTQATVGDFTTGTAAFVRYADTYVVPSGQTTTRFVLAPIDTGSVGNLVDLVAFELTCEISVTTSFDGWTDIDTSGDHSAGDIYAFTYEVTNLGTATLATVGVVDTLGGTVVCDDTVLVPGATTSCALDHIATQVEIDAGTVTSDATASGTDAGGVTTTGSDVLSVPTPEAPGITLIKTGAVDASIVAPTSRPDAGDAIEYSFVVTNTGNVTLTTVGVTDGSLGVSCPGDTLSPDASMTCTATATIGQPDLEAGSVTNTATASGTSPASAVVDATSTEVVALDRVPSVAIAKTSPTSSFDSVGQTIDYDLVVSNTGNVTLEGLNVTDPNADSGSIVCSPAAPFALSPGADATCTAQHTVTQDDLDAGSVDNTASVSGAAPSSGTNVEADSNAVEVQADQRLDLTITQTATAVPLGDGRFTVDYVATVTNTGNVTASSVEIVDDLTGVFGGSAFTVTGSTSTDLPVNLTFDGSTDAVLVSGPVSLAPNASGSVSYRVIVGPTAETGPWSDTIDATIATASLSASGTTGSSVVFDTSFDLAITKTTQKSVAPGDPVTWSIVVTNTGTSASLGTITVTDHLVDDLHYVGFEAEGWSCTHAHGLVTCTTSDPLAAGDATTIGVTTTVHAEIGSTITNSALVVAGDVVNETDPTNNGSVAAVTVDSLPVTGMNTGDVGAIAIALLALGALLVLVSGRRTRRDDRQIV